MSVLKLQGKKSNSGHKLRSTQTSKNETQKRAGVWGGLDYMMKTIFIGKMR